MKKDLSFGEKLWYYAIVILSLGFWFGVKVVIKKAIIEASEK